MPRRLPSLDGWRAVAIIMVMASHLYADPNCPPLVAKWTYAIIDGNLGVRFFFTISGFIITWLLLEEQAGRGSVSLRDFYWRRGLRILPVYFTYLLVVFLLDRLGWARETGSSWLGSLTFTRNLFGRGDSPTVHFWSLAVEEQFYLVWPLLLVTLRFYERRKAFYLFSGFVIIGAILARARPIPGSPQSWLDRIDGLFSALRYADSIVIGCAAAFINSPKIRKPQPWLTIGGYLGTLLFAILSNLVEFSPAIRVFLPTFQAACFAIIMVESIGSSGLTARILNQPLLVRIGVLSYSLYVWHVLFAFPFGPPDGRLAFIHRWYVWVVPAFVASMLSYHLIERPIRAFKDSNPFGRPSVSN